MSIGDTVKGLIFKKPSADERQGEDNPYLTARRTGFDTKGNAQDGTKAGKGSTSTIANLAQGAMDVARANLAERIGETTGGRIADAIRASGQGAETNISSTFNNNSLSAGTSEPDPESEVAAFRDRNSQTA